MASDESGQRHKDTSRLYLLVFPRKVASGSAIRVGLEFSARCSARRYAKEVLWQTTLRVPSHPGKQQVAVRTGRRFLLLGSAIRLSPRFTPGRNAVASSPYGSASICTAPPSAPSRRRRYPKSMAMPTSTLPWRHRARTRMALPASRFMESGRAWGLSHRPALSAGAQGARGGPVCQGAGQALGLSRRALHACPEDQPRAAQGLCPGRGLDSCTRGSIMLQCCQVKRSREDEDNDEGGGEGAWLI